jgi:FOG: FHA domain
VAAEDRNELPLHRASPSEIKLRLEAERAGIPFLLYFSQGGHQQIVVLEEQRRGRVTVGRGAAIDVRLDWDSDVSRLHAELEHLGGCWTIADDGLSRNGTFLNGERLRGRARLRDLDRLRFGTTTVIYRAPPPPSRPTGETVARTTVGVEAADVGISAAQRRVLIALARPYFAQGHFSTPATNRRDRSRAARERRYRQDAPARAHLEVRHRRSATKMPSAPASSSSRCSMARSPSETSPNTPSG